MTLIAFLWALFKQMPADLQGNAWVMKSLELTLSNLYAIQSFFGWVSLIVVALCILAVIVSAVLGGKGIGKVLTASGCLIQIAVGASVFWLVGFVHILVVGYLAANYTLAGAANPGFWIVLALMILFSWS